MTNASQAAVRAAKQLYNRARLSLAEQKSSTAGFSGEVVAEIREKRRLEIESPILDDWRFPEEGAQKYPLSNTWRTLEFVASNRDGLNKVASWFKNSNSKDLMKSLLAFRALGPAHVQLPGSIDIKRCYEQANNAPSSPSEFLSPPFEISNYAINFNGEDVKIECWLGNVVATFYARQYYINRGGVEIAPRRGDIVIDAGACFGDTALAFASTVGPEGAIHSFEPVPGQAEIFEKNMRSNSNLEPRVHLHRYALSDVAGQTIHFSDTGASAGRSDEGLISVKTTTIDELAKQNVFSRVDFIKMDIEGDEMAALRGAAEVIKKHKPRLAISLYHRLKDFVDIPAQIKSICPEYEFYLGHHSLHQEETVLYAVAHA